MEPDDKWVLDTKTNKKYKNADEATDATKCSRRTVYRHLKSGNKRFVWCEPDRYPYIRPEDRGLIFNVETGDFYETISAASTAINRCRRLVSKYLSSFSKTVPITWIPSSNSKLAFKNPMSLQDCIRLHKGPTLLCNLVLHGVKVKDFKKLEKHSQPNWDASIKLLKKCRYLEYSKEYFLKPAKLRTGKCRDIIMMLAKAAMVQIDDLVEHLSVHFTHATIREVVTELTEKNIITIHKPCRYQFKPLKEYSTWTRHASQMFKPSKISGIVTLVGKEPNILSESEVRFRGQANSKDIETRIMKSNLKELQKALYSRIEYLNYLKAKGTTSGPAFTQAYNSVERVLGKIIQLKEMSVESVITTPSFFFYKKPENNLDSAYLLL